MSDTFGSCASLECDKAGRVPVILPNGEHVDLCDWHADWAIEHGARLDLGR